MKYKFSEEALLEMAVRVSRQEDSPFVRSLHSKLHRVWLNNYLLLNSLWGALFPSHLKVELSSDELAYLQQVCDECDGSLASRDRASFQLKAYTRRN